MCIDDNLALQARTGSTATCANLQANNLCRFNCFSALSVCCTSCSSQCATSLVASPPLPPISPLTSSSSAGVGGSTDVTLIIVGTLVGLGGTLLLILLAWCICGGARWLFGYTMGRIKSPPSVEDTLAEEIIEKEKTRTRSVLKRQNSVWAWKDNELHQTRKASFAAS